jgi:hypothetical protein
MSQWNVIEIRLLVPTDGASLARLAELDTRETPPSPVLGGIVGGRLVAARSLATGESVADPFLRTSDIQTLLAQRARQLRGPGRGRRLMRGLRDRLRRGVAAEPERASEAAR